MNMTAQFHEPNMAYNTVLSNNVTFNGAITNRRLDDKRNVYFASGNVKQKVECLLQLQVKKSL